jgi:hypothetical protein
MRPLLLAGALAFALALVPAAGASHPLPAGVTVDPSAPLACVWTDGADDFGTNTCADPTNPECIVYTVYDTIVGPFFICHVPAP